MVYDGVIKGKFVYLKSVLEKDAEVTLRMRLDQKKTQFLHPVENDVEKQRAWIKTQNDLAGDYFFLAFRCDGDEPLGTCGIYEIKDSVGHIGRLLSYGSALETFEAYYLLINFCFEELRLSRIWGDTDVNNKSAYAFSKQFGFQYGEPQLDAELNRNVSICNLTQDLFKNSNIRKLIYRGA